MPEGETLPVFSAKNLDAGYNGKATVAGINISAKKGNVLCLIGPNGAGKTTILRTFAGLLPPVRGEALLSGENIAAIKAAERARRLAVVLTEQPFSSLTSAYEIVAAGRTPYTNFFGALNEKDHKIARGTLETVGAAELADRDFLSLSDGEKQKVMIARALAQQPEIIILDEPTSHLDIRHKLEVMEIVNHLARETGLVVILALHDIDLALKYCGFVLFVKDGRILAEGKPEEIVTTDEDTVSGKLNEPNEIERIFSLENASFDAVMGGVEAHNTNPARIFVVPGGGRGAKIFRLFSRRSIGIAAGVLHRGDLDHRIARLMRLPLVESEAFLSIKQSTLDHAFDLMRGCTVVIDSGFPVGETNRGNIELLRRALDEGMRCYTFRKHAEAEVLFGKEARKFCYAGGISDLEGIIDGP
ncbi:MAG: ABC transporter ATP-binding protein [Treponema sp.]|jgi:iron complex transport system ATP-binding protein|nr:ABC transporter ATP-binding protein [Treponema sp.]